MVLATLAALREEHYTLLMMATVALFATAAAGLTLQMAFAGAPRASPAPPSSRWAPMWRLSGEYGYPAPSRPAHRRPCGGGAGARPAAAGAAHAWRHYAALVTIAFGLLLRAFLRNDVLGGPQGMKVKSFSCSASTSAG